MVSKLRRAADVPALSVRQKVPRHEKVAATRAAIVDAALDEFCANGFAGARLDDVARRAGVAKGTIYVHFRDKETLFEELVRASIVPLIEAMEQPPAADLSLREFAEQLTSTFAREVVTTRRRDVLRLVMSEGVRFPQLSHIYYREVVQRAVSAIRGAVERAIARGEVENDALLRFPQLLFAPALAALLWQERFSRFEPLNIGEMMRTHLDLTFAALEKRAS